MIQRVQSLWLIIVALTAFATSRLSIYEGQLPNDGQLPFLLSSNLPLAIAIISIGALALICLFLFKNRKLQFRLSILGMILSIGFLFLEYYIVENFFRPNNNIQVGTYQLGALLPVVMVIFFFLAARGIYRDQKLIKSMDRLR